jgi:hypothetical protein
MLGKMKISGMEWSFKSIFELLRIFRQKIKIAYTAVDSWL